MRNQEKLLIDWLLSKLHSLGNKSLFASFSSEKEESSFEVIPPSTC